MHDCSGSGIATGYSPPQSDIYTNHFVTPKARENTFDFYHFYPIWEGSRWKNRADCNYLNLQMPSKRKAFNILQCKSFGVQFKTIFLIFVQGLELTRGSKSRHMSRYVEICSARKKVEICSQLSAALDMQIVLNALIAVERVTCKTRWEALSRLSGLNPLTPKQNVIEKRHEAIHSSKILIFVILLPWHSKQEYQGDPGDPIHSRFSPKLLDFMTCELPRS